VIPAPAALDVDEPLGDEGYRLRIRDGEARIDAETVAGRFYAERTLRRLSGGGRPPDVAIADRPRFAWRGLMLDVARHFFGVVDVCRIVDLLADYKLNVLHLHMSGEQGSRLAAAAPPTAPGGFYTRDDMRTIVRYAAERNVWVVPEIAFTTNDGDVEDVLAALAALVPGPYLHVGGDVEHAAPLLDEHGKWPVGWEEAASARLPEGALVQHWRDAELARAAAEQGAQLVMSPARHVYLDMKYDARTPLGADWAGHVELEDSYDWDPAELVEGVGEESILGVEAPLWTETIATREQLETMLLPRLCAVAEVAWSPHRARDWESFRTRVAAESRRWDAAGIAYHRSPHVDWR
jgi:hexosaminidase